MLPDFSKPAFSFFALCTTRFLEHRDGSPRRIQSDYRCQLRYKEDDESATDTEARIYLVGQEQATSGEELPTILAFLDWERQPIRCRVGSQFELREGINVTAVGTVLTLAVRDCARRSE